MTFITLSQIKSELSARDMQVIQGVTDADILQDLKKTKSLDRAMESIKDLIEKVPATDYSEGVEGKFVQTDEGPVFVPAQPNVVTIKQPRKKVDLTKRMFIIKASGAELGRGRYITPTGESSPTTSWKFQAAQFIERQEAELYIKLFGRAPGITLTVETFDNAWYESQDAAIQRETEKKAKKAA